jgi:hypothetical protein
MQNSTKTLLVVGGCILGAILVYRAFRPAMARVSHNRDYLNNTPLDYGPQPVSIMPPMQNTQDNWARTYPDPNAGNIQIMPPRERTVQPDQWARTYPAEGNIRAPSYLYKDRRYRTREDWDAIYSYRNNTPANISLVNPGVNPSDPNAPGYHGTDKFSVPPPQNIELNPRTIYGNTNPNRPGYGGADWFYVPKAL